MTIRAKFKLQEIHQVYWNTTARKFVFGVDYDKSIPEDQRFYQSTPSGRFEMIVDNPRVIETFKLGQQYYVDFTEVPEVPA